MRTFSWRSTIENDLFYIWILKKEEKKNSQDINQLTHSIEYIHTYITNINFYFRCA